MSQLNQIKLQNEVFCPSKIVCVGRNYVEHIVELGNEVPQQPVIFCKPNTAISEDLYLDSYDDIHYEAELSFLVKENNICAVALGLDLTKRNLQTKLKAKGLPWERAKAFDKAAVFSEFVPFENDFENLSFQLFIDGELRQVANFALMMLKPLQLLAEINNFMTLLDGDIIMTGTPKGVGKIKAGSTFSGKLFRGDVLLLDKEWKVKEL